MKIEAVVFDAYGTLFDLESVISVDEAKTYKPSPAVYGLGPLQLGVPASAIAFVSSNYWDAAGAARFGFRTFWINRAQSAEEELGARPDAIPHDARPFACRDRGALTGTCRGIHPAV